MSRVCFCRLLLIYFSSLLLLALFVKRAIRISHSGLSVLLFGASETIPKWHTHEKKSQFGFYWQVAATYILSHSLTLSPSLPSLPFILYFLSSSNVCFALCVCVCVTADRSMCTLHEFKEKILRWKKIVQNVHAKTSARTHTYTQTQTADTKN